MAQRLISISLTIFLELNKDEGSTFSPVTHIKPLQTRIYKILGILYRIFTFTSYLLYTVQILIMPELYACNIDVMGNIFLAPGQMLYPAPNEQRITHES